jgi:ABC-type histidine transport system ATPase subunit
LLFLLGVQGCGPTGSPAASSSASRSYRALAMRPDLMLLDEVTSALDPDLVAEVLNVIRELAEAGMTMVIATHEMAFARDIADRRVLPRRGRDLEQGLPERMFTGPREPRTQQFLQRITEAGRLLRQPATGPGSRRAKGPGLAP